MNERVDGPFFLTCLHGRSSDLLVQSSDRHKDDGAHEKRHKREYPIKPDHDDRHSDNKETRGKERKQTIHRQALNRIGVGGDPIQQIADLTASVKGERKALKMIIEITPQVIDQSLSNADARIVVQESQRGQQQINQDEPHARCQQKRLGRPVLAEADRQRLATQDMVNNEL